MNKAEKVLDRKINYTIVPMFLFRIGSLFNQQVKELTELLPRYKYDNVFKSNKFKDSFPEFKVTTYEEGIRNILKGD
ncbi:hypothetical protein SD311_013810 [Staphylococcus sp. KG4-3]|nr:MULTISPECIES: hypothetical protein [Staphylococcus]MDW8543414.1 hypothetical protein [Staphylococcus sp. KG4-1]MDW8562838.1 hypothetical protein [Staphylococcus sp. KG4-3]